MSIEQHSATALTLDSDSALDIFPTASASQLAWADVRDGLLKWPIWLMLAYQDIKVRYRRSKLGPFWITLSMAITVYSMGFLYAHLFHIQLDQYYPFLVSGMLTWGLISTVISDLTETFMISESLIKQIKLPYTLYIHRVIMRNLIIFMHNFLVMIPIYFIFHGSAKIDGYSLLIIPGLALIYLNAFIYGLILAMLGARYRDIVQIIRSLIQVVFFVTPIMWSPSTLPPQDRMFIMANPFYSFVELVRAPLIGTAPSLFNLGMVLATTIIGFYFCRKMFVRYRPRIIYWL